MSEHHLGRSGVLAPENLMQIGRMLQAQAVVVGSFASIGTTIELHARLIQIETGVILAARTKRLKGVVLRNYDVIPLPKLDVPVPSLDIPMPPLFRDALLDVRCTDSEARVNMMEKSILDVKARYWATRIKEGGISGLISNPGSEILNPEIRRRFYGLLESLYREQDLSRPSHFEIYQMKKTMERILRLIQTCGGEAPELERAIRQTTGG